MHGLKAQKDELMFLHGAELMQVAIGQNELILNFSNSATLSIFSKIRIGYPGGRYAEFTDFPRAAAIVCELLGSEIVKLGLDAGGRTLTLWFGDVAVSVSDDSDQYESFVITFGDRVFVA